MTDLPNSRAATWIVSMAFPLLMITCIGCGVTQAPHANAVLRSSNQMEVLILGIRTYYTVNDSQWPEQLSDVESLTDMNFDVLMSNPITGDTPGYQYVKPSDDADIATTVILYQLRNGQRAIDLRVGYADGHVAELTLKIEVVGTYRNGDAEYVREQLEAILPDDIRNSSWGTGGNRFEYEIPTVSDVEVLADQIQFGEVFHVDPRLIRVQYGYDHVVPARFKEAVPDWRKPPEDELGPALKKHDGDWWAALGDFRATRQKNEHGEITHLGLPSSEATDETMAQVAELTSLKELNLAVCRHVTDAGARYLAGLTNLEKLNLFGTSIGNRGQVHLSDLTELRRLELSGNGTEAGLRHIAGLTGLERLSIARGDGYPVSTEGLEYLTKMEVLQLLRLDGCEISDDGLRIVAGFTQLTSLGLRKGKMTDVGLAHLSGLTQLHGLNLWDCTSVGDDGIVHLSTLENLSHLNLRGTQLTDRGLEHLQSLRNLWTLTLFGTRVTDAGICELEPFPELISLSLDETEITDVSLEHLKSFPKLTSLYLSDTKITDAGCKHLGEMTGLRTLQIDGTQVTDAGMAQLAGLAKLRSIDISNTSITEQGLQHLRDASILRDIRAEESGVTQRAIQRFMNR